MRSARPISPEAKAALQRLLKKTKSKADFQRVQCLWLRAALNLSSAEVATALGWSPGTVRRIWSQYLAEGESALIGKKRGGRRHQNLSVTEEERLLAELLGKAKAEEVWGLHDVKAAYEKAVGHPVPKSTIYRMLARHGWRPRPPNILVQKKHYKLGRQGSGRD
jgi:transposase